MCFFFTHLTVIAFHVIVFVHGHNSNGFIRPLVRNSDRQMQLKPISPEDTQVSYSLQLLSVCQKLQKINKKCEHTDVSQELNCLYFHLLLCITILELKCLSIVPLSLNPPCCCYAISGIPLWFLNLLLRTKNSYSELSWKKNTDMHI